MPIEKCGLYHKQCRELCTAAANELLKDEEIKPESNAKRNELGEKGPTFPMMSHRTVVLTTSRRATSILTGTSRKFPNILCIPLG